MTEPSKPFMRLTSDISGARAELAKINCEIKALVWNDQFPEAHNRVYNAEKIAYDSGLFDDAAEYRKAREVLRKGRIPQIFSTQGKTTISPAELAERMKVEIIDNVRNGFVPVTVASFSELHDYVDANCYGGTEVLYDEMDKGVPDTDEAHRAVLDALCDLMNPAMDAVDAWIKAGGIPRAVEATSGRQGSGQDRLGDVAWPAGICLRWDTPIA